MAVSSDTFIIQRKIFKLNKKILIKHFYVLTKKSRTILSLQEIVKNYPPLKHFTAFRLVVLLIPKIEITCVHYQISKL